MNDKVVVRTHDTGSVATAIWFMGWLFTIGFLKLSFWKAVLALVAWAYFLGVALRPV